jgi:hypothetical protein
MDEFPKMLYKHPVDKTQEHKTLIVNNPDEEADALANCHRYEPHIPVSSANNEPEWDCPGSGTERYDGSGSERWPHTGWTEAGDGTNYPGMPNLPTQEQADAVAAKAEAEVEQRKQEAASEGKGPEEVI